MIERLLVANRGEIGLRIVRACRDLGVTSIAAHSAADRELPFVRAADEAVEIGPGPARQSYLDVEAIVAAAVRSGADAVHPGYGFLSEDARLARAVRDAGLVFVGPAAEVIERLGDKLATRALMREAGVAVAPGTGAIGDVDKARYEAERIGYPLLVKPSGGGGGRGMRLVREPRELAAAIEQATREAERAATGGDVYLEKVIEPARHVEVQILVDTHGNALHLGDRDCSLQRRRQKVVEEAPAPGLDAAQRARICEIALRAARAAGYVSAGTVEFLHDGAHGFYLLEVNTRIQVEHAVTEMVSGVDLVAEQIRIAAGERLALSQAEVRLDGAAIECRIYAEDPARAFMPAPGTIAAADFPGGPWVREDRGYHVGDAVTPHYDGLLSKLIAWGPTREVAAARMRRALHEYRIAGIATNVAFLRWLLASEEFAAQRFDTGFIEREFRAELLSAVPAGIRSPTD